jgi:hypothetical protein
MKRKKEICIDWVLVNSKWRESRKLFLSVLLKKKKKKKERKAVCCFARLSQTVKERKTNYGECQLSFG